MVTLLNMLSFLDHAQRSSPNEYSPNEASLFCATAECDSKN